MDREALRRGADDPARHAPRVAYPDKAWQTSWQDQTTIIGRALGRSADADELVASTKAWIAEAATAPPEFAGKSLSVAYFAKPEINVYTPTDPRVQLLTQLGFTDSARVTALAKTTKNFHATLAWEKVDTLDADVVVGYVDDLTVKQFSANKLAAKLGAVRTKSAYILSDTMVIGALSQPTVLSVGYTLERVLPALSTAAKNAA